MKETPFFTAVSDSVDARRDPFRLFRVFLFSPKNQSLTLHLDNTEITQLEEEEEDKKRTSSRPAPSELETTSKPNQTPHTWLPYPYSIQPGTKISSMREKLERERKRKRDANKKKRFFFSSFVLQFFFYVFFLFLERGTNPTIANGRLWASVGVTLW